MEVDILKETHADYNRHKDEWLLSKETWKGGLAYITKHLRKINRKESNSLFDRRKDAAQFDNIARAIGRLYLDSLYGSSDRVHREVDQSPLDDILQRADRAGRDFDSFMWEVAMHSLTQTYCGVLIQKRGVDENGLGGDLRPFLTIIEPLSITNWGFDDDDVLDWVRIVRKRNISRPNEKAQTVDDYFHFFRDGWEQFNEKGEQVGGSPYSIIVDGKPVIPIAFSYFERGIDTLVGNSWFFDIARANKSSFNLESRLQTSMERYLSPLLKRRVDMGVPTPTRDLEAEAIVNTFDYVGDTPPEYLVVQTEGWKHAQEKIDGLAMQMYRTAGFETRRRSVEIAQSAESKSIDENKAAKLIKAWGANEQDAEDDIFKIAAAWESQEFRGDIDYPKTYDIPAVEEDLIRFEKTREVFEDLSTTIIEREALRTYERMQVDDLEPDERAKIVGEIQAALVRHAQAMEGVNG